MIKITYYEVYCERNNKQVEEPVCVCLYESRAIEVCTKANRNEYRFLTARPPFKIRIMERDYEPTSKDIHF